jgi:purine-cytosine permease-like protein
MDHPVHAAEMIDKNEGVPKIVAAVAGLALLAIAAGVMMYTGYWSPPATTVSDTQPAKH